MADNKNKLLTYSDIFDNPDFPVFNNDKERLKYMKEAYSKMSLGKAMSIYYGVDINPALRQNQYINNIINIEVGNIYSGTVKEMTKQTISFDVPGIKEEIICKENFGGCEDQIQNYLLTHGNKLPFEVREKKNNKYYVSIVQALYQQWVDMINKAIQREDGIEVHIDGLVQGGYLCHVPISTLTNVTGRNYTHSVFIPGSHIVLNIEHDFNKWIGKDVVIIPQKFVEFRKNFKTGETENSLVGSRKRVLQILGMNNLATIYNNYKLGENDNVKYVPQIYDGVVTGIINSQKKTGVFVEIENQYITGLANIDSSELLDYKPGTEVRVRIKEFEIQDGKEPFIYNKKGKLLKCNVRPIFEFV